MAFQQRVNISLTITPDGTSTEFSIDLDKLYAASFSESTVLNKSTIPDAVLYGGGAAVAPTVGMRRRIIDVSFANAPTEAMQLVLVLLFNL